jgi:D-threo-aldose 1-dehydrogenase
VARLSPLVARGAIGLGCAPLGNLFTAITGDDAHATVDAAWNAGVRLFDTAPLYGHGLSEARLGAALRSRPRHDYVLSTKVGRLLRVVSPRPTSVFADPGPLDPVFDFSADGVRRSIEESLRRLGVDRLDIVHVHDPDEHETQAVEEAFPALIELRDQGVIGKVGCGMNQTAMLERFVQRIDLDCILVAGRFTLLDRSAADTLLPLCAERDVGVIVGGVFNSGLLADPSPGATYDYAAAPAGLVRRAQRMRRLCAEQGVSLAAAALQFARRHPAVTALVVGARSAAEFAADMAALDEPVSDELLTACAQV